MTPKQLSHLSAEVVAAYVKRTLPPSRTAFVEEHLSECQDCRREVVEVGRILREGLPAQSNGDRWRWRWWAAAAVVALAVSYPLARTGSPGPPGDVIAPDRSIALPLAGLQATSPADEATFGPDRPLRFEWAGGQEGSTYRFVLLDSAGGLMWRTDAASRTLSLGTEQVTLESGTYFWYVDAVGPDGRSLTTGPVRLRIR